MAFLVTREDLRLQLREEIRYCSTSGAGSDVDLNRRLQREVNRVWERLVPTAQGVGQGALSVTITPGDPDGYEPGARIPLPSDFRRLVLLRVDRYEPAPSTPQEVESYAVGAVTAPANVGLLYYLTGPGQDTDVDPPVPTAQQVRLWPDWRAGQQVVLVYAVQPPTLGDPADAADDTIELDLMHEPVVRYVVSRAAVRSVNREDQQGYQRAVEEQMAAEDEFTRAIARRSDAPPLSSYRKRRGWSLR